MTKNSNPPSGRPDFGKARIINLKDVLEKRQATPRATTRARSGLLRRPREDETFARIPHDRAIELFRHRIGGPAWAALIELDRMILAQRGKNPVIFWSPKLRAAGLKMHTRARALRELEAAGVIEVTGRGRGLAPLVRHWWYPPRD